MAEYYTGSRWKDGTAAYCSQMAQSRGRSERNVNHWRAVAVNGFAAEWAQRTSQHPPWARAAWHRRPRPCSPSALHLLSQTESASAPRTFLTRSIAVPQRAGGRRRHTCPFSLVRASSASNSSPTSRVSSFGELKSKSSRETTDLTASHVPSVCRAGMRSSVNESMQSEEPDANRVLRVGEARLWLHTQERPGPGVGGSLGPPCQGYSIGLIDRRRRR